MNSLTAHECRVLGVLVEKAQTTPAQYPLSVNAIIAGSNQRSNRNPVLTLTEDDAIDALDGLRAKGLARIVSMTGSRVEKHRHLAREALEVTTSELVILTELLLRGPQTIGELRGRASRMHPLESTDVVASTLEHLMQREPPLVQQLAPGPGSRAAKFGQLLRPDLHPLDAPAAGSPATGTAGLAPMSATTAARDGTDAGSSPARELEVRVARLEADVAALSEAVRSLRASAPASQATPLSDAID